MVWATDVSDPSEYINKKMILDRPSDIAIGTPMNKSAMTRAKRIRTSMD